MLSAGTNVAAKILTGMSFADHITVILKKRQLILSWKLDTHQTIAFDLKPKCLEIH